MKAISQTTGPTAPRGTTPSGVERQARAMYARVGAAWAMDMLALRRSGLDCPGFRKERRLMVTPFFGWEHKRGEAA